MSSPETKMVNPGKQVQMVKVKVHHPIRIVRDGIEQIIQPDQNADVSKRKQTIAEITEEEAKEFCDREFDIGYREIFGNVPKGYVKTTIVKRAERI